MKIGSATSAATTATTSDEIKSGERAQRRAAVPNVEISSIAAADRVAITTRAIVQSARLSENDLREINRILAKAGMSMNVDFSVSLHSSKDSKKGDSKS